MKIAVIGGGAAGMTAAYAAAGPENSVVILEAGKIPGKKILSTGNGRCNLSNREMKKSCFRSGHPDIAWQILQNYDVDKTLAWFKSLGLSFSEKNGYIYPRSAQASAVREALEEACIRKGVQILSSTRVREIRKKKNRFSLVAEDGREFSADRVILTAGGMAAPSTGSDGSGYEIARHLGHRIIPTVPALTSLDSSDKICRQWHGVRTGGHIRLMTEEKILAEDSGELQLVRTGISGIPVFQVSRYASYALVAGKKVHAQIDFLPEFSSGEETQILSRWKKEDGDMRLYARLHGWFPDRLCQVLLVRSGLSGELPCRQLTERDLHRLSEACRRFSLSIQDVHGFDQAQVTAGGVDLSEIDPDTMESRRIRGLYFAGEILDVDGICGGYNLQWAWSSGRCAGFAAGGKEKV